LNGAAIGMLAYYIIAYNFFPSTQSIITAKGWVVIFLVSYLSFLPAIFFSEGVKRIGAARASLISGIGPLMTPVFAYLILGEVLKWGQLCGAVLVVGSIMFLEKKALLVFLKKSRLRVWGRKD